MRKFKLRVHVATLFEIKARCTNCPNIREFHSEWVPWQHLPQAPLDHPAVVVGCFHPLYLPQTAAPKSLTYDEHTHETVRIRRCLTILCWPYLVSRGQGRRNRRQAALPQVARLIAHTTPSQCSLEVAVVSLAALSAAAWPHWSKTSRDKKALRICINSVEFEFLQFRGRLA